MRVFTAERKSRKKSPIPEFIKEYILDSEYSKPNTKQKYVPLFTKSRSRVQTSKPQKLRNSFCIADQKSRTQPIETQESPKQIFHLYKPQILHLSPRSTIRIYSTVPLGERKHKQQRNKSNEFILKNLVKPVVSCQKNVENPVFEPPSAEYLKPALTFGEKL